MKNFSPSTSAFEFTLETGPFPVGLKVVEQHDLSRVFGYATNCLGMPLVSPRPRPLQTLIWYPAKSAGPKPMTVGDYVALSATETTFGGPRLPVTAQEWLAGLGEVATTKLSAARGAPMAAERFPAVIYAPSRSATAWENADLCEYLASHGYVVLSTPSMGERSRAMTRNAAGIQTQARDISFLVGYASSLENADPTQIAVMGFSWGGLSNVVAAARDSRIGSLIALDGSLRFSPGLVTQLEGVHPKKMTIPLMSIVQGHWTPEMQAALWAQYPNDAGPSVMNAWVHGDLVTVRMLGLSHTEYCSMFLRNEEVWWKISHVYPDKVPGYDRADSIAGYSWMARYCLAFLDAYLKHSSAAMNFLKSSPAENGVPPNTMTTSFRTGERLLILFDAFRAAVGQRGFDQVAEVYQAFRIKHADFLIDEVSLMNWAEELLNQDHLLHAASLLQFNVELHPRSPEAHTALARAYQRCGALEQSLQQYRKAVEIDSTNADALWNLHASGERARRTS